MSTWKPGDRALCVGIPGDAVLLESRPNGGPKKGVVYLVDRVTYNEFSVDGCGAECDVSLVLAGLPRIWNGYEYGWRHTAFRRIVPACDRVAEEQKQSAGLERLLKDVMEGRQ